MRLLMAGILCLFLATVASAQATGQVQSVGFGTYIRPGCWTPMLIKLTPTTGSPFTGRIEVVQDDLDKDEVIFTRQVTLTGNSPNGPPLDQRFWMYFIPQPNRGDRETIEDGMNAADLTGLIKVRLCNENGKELAQLPLTQTIKLLESYRAGGGINGTTRGQKAILSIIGRDRIDGMEYGAVVGLNEDVAFQSIPEAQIPYTLPDDVRGYDGIDAILWGDADPLILTPDQLTAIEAFVRRGGKLVFTQDTATNQWQRNGVKFPLLMPVMVQGVEERSDVATLRQLARVKPESVDFLEREKVRAWDALKGPFRYAAAEPAPGAVVTVWQTDKDGKAILDAAGKPKPYVVRRAVGSGCVTWVAQDLGDKQLLGERATTSGWTHVWDELFDWPNESVPNTRQQTGSQTNADPKMMPYSGGTTWELGKAFLKMMEIPSTSAALIGIAVLFFIVYWVAAGPGSYFVLLRRNKATMSWFTFGAIAIGGTFLTIGIVKLVLRGAPQLQHFSVVRVAPNEPSIVRSEFGLYIPRDGNQRIELKDTAPNRSSYVTAFNIHPAFNTGDFDFPARQPYIVPVKEVREAGQAEAYDPKVINVPYRSTLKKFQAQWVGDLPIGIEGKVTLANDTPLIQGKLTNKTGRDLRRVYLFVNHPAAFTRDDKPIAADTILFVSFWANGSSLNLTELFGQRNQNGAAKDIAEGVQLVDSSNPNAQRAFRGHIFPDTRFGLGLGNNWANYWYGQNWRQSGGFDVRDFSEDEPLSALSFPMLSFYDRLPVSQNEVGVNVRREPEIKKNDRFDLVRRGLRWMDMSAAVSAGNMAIIAVADSRAEKLPFPLDVDRDRVEGKGIVYYQFVHPVDRSAVTADNPATTQPTTKPSKGKAEG